MAAVVEVSLMAGTVSLAARVVSMADTFAAGAEVGVKAVVADEDSMGTALVPVEEVGGAGFFSLAETEVSSRAETVLLMTGVVSLEVALALGIAVAAEVAIEVVLKTSLLADVVGGAGFFSLAETEVSSWAETVLLMTGVLPLEVDLELGIAVAAVVAVEVVLEVATLLAEVVETGVAREEGVVVESLEATPELSVMVEAWLASMTLLADDFDLVMVEDI
jgi:hypothetical protein